MKKFKNLFRIIIAALIGEAILIILITLVQENIFGGITYTESPLFDIIFAGLGTFLSAFTAGVTTYLIVGKKTIAPLLIITVLITAESIWLLFYSGSKDPLWFDAMASSSLLVGIWLGVLIFNLDRIKKFLFIKKEVLE